MKSDIVYILDTVHIVYMYHSLTRFFKKNSVKIECLELSNIGQWNNFS